jgi:predicted transcriptional regulator
MLCEAVNKLADAGLPMSPTLKAWYTAHKKEDEARIEAENRRLAKEAKRTAILSKLSKEEKKILGL